FTSSATRSAASCTATRRRFPMAHDVRRLGELHHRFALLRIVSARRFSQFRFAFLDTPFRFAFPVRSSGSFFRFALPVRSSGSLFRFALPICCPVLPPV